MDRPRINFQAQADELGDNYFVSFSKTKRSEEHWTFYLVCSGVLFLMGWQSLRFKRDFVLHSGWSIFDGFVLIVLATVLVAMLLPRERDPNESVKTTILVHESTIFQKGRLPIMREFTNFVLSNPAWWVNNVASLLARYVETDEPDKGENEEEDDEQRRKEELALVELEEITVRVLNLVYRIIRTSAAPKVLRKMLREEANTYVHWCIGDGFIFNYIAALPEALSDLNFDPRYAPKTKLLDAHQTKRYRLWLKHFLAAHLFKRHLWSQTPPVYPNFSQRCVVCQDREVEVAFIGCGHAVTCGDCGRMCLYGTHNSTGLCPICRRPIEVLTDDTLGSSSNPLAKKDQ